MTGLARNRPAVAVAGGGPVGLFQALVLQARGWRPIVLERRSEPHGGSRSIGIHPPSLEILDELGLADRFVAEGVRVERGRAFVDREPLATVDFGRCPGRFPFILALPQHRTETILAEALEAREPGAIRWGVEVDAVTPTARDVCLGTSDGEVRARYAIACDGKRSRVRELLGVDFEARPYAGTYAMRDHPDQTPFGQDAAVFLCREGLVESFPLPGGQRRWVARTDGAPFGEVIERRTGYRLPDDGPASVFRAERGIASRLACGRVALGGDAAHVVSPIGGQGMNLGWLGAVRIAGALERASLGWPRALRRDGRVRARMARAAARRAEANMWLGRPTACTRLRSTLVRTLTERPVGDVLCRAFTMRGLRWGV